MIGWIGLGVAHATWTTNVNYVRAAEIAPPEGTRRVVLLDLAARDLEEARLPALDEAMARFRSKAQSSEGIEVVYVPTLNNPDLSVDPSWEELDRLAASHDAQAVIALDQLSFTLANPSVNAVEETVTREGVETVERRFVASRRITVEASWRYWDTRRKVVHHEVDGLSYYRTAKGKAKVRQAARARMQQEVPAQFAPLARSIADWYAAKVFATRMRGRRTFFANGKLKAGRKYAAVGKWVDARKTWRALWDNGKRSGMKARYNVALTHEVTGNPAKALEVLDPLVGVWNKDLVESYYRTLKSRVANEARLEEQGL